MDVLGLKQRDAIETDRRNEIDLLNRRKRGKRDARSNSAPGRRFLLHARTRRVFRILSTKAKAMEFSDNGTARDIHQLRSDLTAGQAEFEKPPQLRYTLLGPSCLHHSPPSWLE